MASRVRTGSISTTLNWHARFHWCVSALPYRSPPNCSPSSSPRRRTKTCCLSSRDSSDGSIGAWRRSNQQSWLEFLAQSRADLLRSFWSAYDPDNLLEGDDEARDLVGDSALGISLFFSFLASTALINERDAERWSNVWSFLAYTDLVTDDESDTAEESQETSQPRRDEW